MNQADDLNLPDVLTETDRKLLMSIYTIQKKILKRLDLVCENNDWSRENISSMRKEFTQFRGRVRGSNWKKQNEQKQ